MATAVADRFAPISVADRPAHVPPELVMDLAWARGEVPVTYDEPFRDTEVFFDGKTPPLMWMPDCISGHPGVGSWIVSRYEDISRVYQDSDLFSTHTVAAFQAMAGETWPSIPLGIDPPDHGKYRAMLNPYFSPKAVDALEAKIRAGAASLIDGFAKDGTVDVSYDFSRIFPVRVVMDLMGYPFAMFEQFVTWFYEILHSHDVSRAVENLRGILAYIRQFVDEQKANPGPELAGRIVTSQVGGRPITDDEIMGTIFFLWLGGIDTVAGSLAMMFRRLAKDRALQQKLRDDPALIPDAIEEFLRTQPLVNSQRLVKKDFELYGQAIKQGDWVTCLITAGNFDPAEFDNPRQFRMDRQGNRHFTFSGGPHRCLGSHLARRELKIALEEFFARVPTFRLADDDTGLVNPGLQSARHVKLAW